MMKTMLSLLLVLICSWGTAQNTGRQLSKQKATTMVLEGRVLTEQGQALSNVNIEGSMGRYTTTDGQGYFSLPANMGDEIVIRGLDFETVYYRIQSFDHIEIRVVNTAQDQKKLSRISFESAMDSASYYLKRDAEKSADFLIAALSNNPKELTPVQEASAYEKLGDLYSFNQQYDLALDNYNQAIALRNSTHLNLKKAEVLLANGNFQEAINLLLSQKSSNKVQELKRFSKLGAAYQKTNQAQKALAAYQSALELAQELGKPKQITLTNSKIASLLNELGRLEEAERYYNNAMEASKKEGVLSNVATQSATADFYSSNQQFGKEIALRKMNLNLMDSINERSANSENAVSDAEIGAAPDEPALDEVEIEAELAESKDIASDILPTTKSPVNPVSKQKEQLKIAEALRSQRKIGEAIQYFETSLKEAQKNKDLDTQKEAAYALYDLNKKRGALSKALAYNEIYTESVEALYDQKQQELQAASRRTKELLNKQTRVLSLEKDRELTENKLALINTEQALSQQVNQRQRWVIYSLVLVSLLLLTLAYFMHRTNKQQRINNHLLALKSLKSQMNPHFIFNALNSVNSYIARNDERAANKYLADFSKLMRSVLENSELDFISFQKELELIGLYLKLEHERFKDKFDYELIVDPQLEQTQLEVPPMLLQPVIENAVWHGLRYKKEKGQLSVAFEPLVEQGGREGILVSITDNGIGREQSKILKTEHQKKQDSKGLGNIENRVALLNELHDCEIEMNVTDAGFTPDLGTRVQIKIKNPQKTPPNKA